MLSDGSRLLYPRRPFVSLALTGPCGQPSDAEPLGFAFVDVGGFLRRPSAPSIRSLGGSSRLAGLVHHSIVLHGSRHALLPPHMTLTLFVMLGIRGGPLSRLGRQSTLSLVGYVVFHRRRRLRVTFPFTRHHTTSRTWLMSRSHVGNVCRRLCVPPLS